MKPYSQNTLIALRLCLILFLSATLFCTQAATFEQIDSLCQIYEKSHGATRLATGQKLMGLLQGEEVFFNDAPTISAKQPQGLNDLYICFAAERFYTTNAYYKEALAIIEKTLPEASKLKTDDIYCTLLCDKAYCLYKTSDYQQSISVGQQARQQCKQKGNTLQLSRAYLYLSLVNYALQNHEEAIQLVEKAISTNRKLGNNVQMHNVLGVACELYTGARQLDKAIDYGQQAVEEARRINFQPGVANHLTQLSYAYNRKGEFKRGLDMANEAISLVQKEDPIDRNQLAISLEFKSWNLLDLHRNEEAVAVIREAIRLEQEVGNTHAVWNNYRTLCEALEPINPQEALNVLKRYMAMSDSIHNQQLKELMSEANAAFHNEELTAENQASHRRNRLILWSALGVLVVLSAVIASLLYAYRKNRTTSQTMKRLNEVREQFFTNITHEFRTPLTIILGLGQKLQGEASLGRQEVQEMGRTIVRSGNGLLQLINQLLDISKVKSAIGTPQWRRGDVVPYVRMIVDNFRMLGNDKKVEVSFLPRSMAVDMDFIPDYISKIVSNLVSNAIKYTPAYGKVDVICEQKGSNLLLTVTDTGAGIRSEMLPHIFDAFVQDSQHSDSIGTGVGLSLVRQIVDAMKGEVKVDSKVGKGTSFAVTLPLRQHSGKWPTFLLSDYAGDNAEPLSTDDDTTDTGFADRPRLLIVEDNADVANYIGSLLGDKYQLIYAHNGVDGLARASELVPDLILTDLMMPEKSGLELCQEVRSSALLSHVPIIIITAKANEDTRIKVIESGASACLFKPFDAEELRVQVASLIHQSQLLRQKFSLKALTDNSFEQQTDHANQAFLAKVGDVVFALMRENRLNSNQLTSRLFMSRSQLNRKILALTGMNTQTYVAHLRINHAKRLLLSDVNMPVGDVAYKCGYEDVAYFSRVFKQLVGVSPTQFRRNPEA